MIDVSLLQPLKANEPIDVTLLGIVIDVTLLAPPVAKARSAILTVPCSIIMLVLVVLQSIATFPAYITPCHGLLSNHGVPEKACSPTNITLGIEMDVSPLQS